MSSALLGLPGHFLSAALERFDVYAISVCLCRGLFVTGLALRYRLGTLADALGLLAIGVGDFGQHL